LLSEIRLKALNWSIGCLSTYTGVCVWKGSSCVFTFSTDVHTWSAHSRNQETSVPFAPGKAAASRGFTRSGGSPGSPADHHRQGTRNTTARVLGPAGNFTAFCEVRTVTFDTGQGACAVTGAEFGHFCWFLFNNHKEFFLAQTERAVSMF